MALGKELRQIEHALAQRRSIFRNTQRRPSARARSHTARIRTGSKIGRAGSSGSMLTGETYNSKRGCSCFANTRNMPLAETSMRQQRKICRQPVGPLTLPNNRDRAADSHADVGAVRIDVGDHPHGCIGAIPAQRVRRAFHVQLRVTIAQHNFSNQTAGNLVRSFHGIVRVISECSLGTPQIGCSHSCKGENIPRLGWRIVRGNTDDRHRNAPVRKILPEGPPFAQRDNPRTRKRQFIRSERESKTRPDCLVGREIRLPRDRVAMHEIEDAMFPRIESRNECRPGHRALRRVRCLEM